MEYAGEVVEATIGPDEGCEDIDNFENEECLGAFEVEEVQDLEDIDEDIADVVDLPRGSARRRAYAQHFKAILPEASNSDV